MKCLSQETLHALVAGELEKAEREAALTHLAGCVSCRKELRSLLVVYSGLLSADVYPACASLPDLEAYIAGASDEQSAARMSRHLEKCPRCKEVLDTLRVSQDPRANFVTKEERLFIIAQAEANAKVVADQAIRTLIPDQPSLASTVWDQCARFFENTVGASLDQRLSYNSGQHLAGALGFSAVPPAELAAAVTVTMTVLALAVELEGQPGGLADAQIRRKVVALARQYGAGIELQKKLRNLLPSMLPRH